MHVELTRGQVRELQSLCIDIMSRENYLKEIETFDSTKMRFEAQLNHSLIKLTESLAGNRYNKKSLSLAQQMMNELEQVKNKYEFDKDFIPLLIDVAAIEIIKMEDIMNCTKREITSLSGYSKESQERFIEVMKDRIQNLVDSVNKIMGHELPDPNHRKEHE